MAGFMSRFSTPEMQARVAALRAHAQKIELKQQMTTTAEVVLTAGAYCAAEAKIGADKLHWMKQKDASGNEDPNSGVPASLVLGIAAHALGFSGQAAEYKSHIHNVANGLLAVTAVDWSRRSFGGASVQAPWSATSAHGEQYEVSAPYQPQAYFGYQQTNVGSDISEAEVAGYEQARTGR